MAYCKTHYYGGSRKYQWTYHSLCSHRWWCQGGTMVPVRIGEAPGD